MAGCDRKLVTDVVLLGKGFGALTGGLVHGFELLCSRRCFVLVEGTSCESLCTLCAI